MLYIFITFLCWAAGYLEFDKPITGFFVGFVLACFLEVLTKGLPH